MIDTIVNSFDIWTDAQGIKSRNRVKSVDNISLIGITQLRSLILDYAIKGRLVTQNINEESANILLKKIENENKQLIKDGRIKESKKLLEISEKEKMFKLPNGWSWARFGNISLIERGGSPRPIESYLTNDSDGLNWIKIGDTEIGGKYITSTREKIRKEGLIKTRMVYPGDFLLTNSMSFGRPYITKIEGCIHDGWLRIHPPSSLNKDYLYYLLSSSYVTQFFKISAAGAVVQNLNADKVRELPIPMPPVDEQHRIVAKVNELMALCDKLEAEQFNNLKTHQTLVKTLLETLTQAADANELHTSWERISEHFDILFCTEDSIEQLKQTILQLAVMGKLVKQDPNDKPASELLKKIAKEKERLVKEGKLKKQPIPTFITEEEKTFKLPNGWEWVRLGSLAAIKGGKRLPAGHSFTVKETPFIYIQVTNMKNGTILKEDLKYISKETQAVISNYTINKEDLYITIAGTIGDVGVVPDFFDGMNLTENAAKIIFHLVNKNWLQKILSSNFLQEQFTEKTKQVAQPKLALHRVESSCIPLCPLDEQDRIVKRVDELFELCDLLKQNIKKSQDLKVLLSKTIIEKAVE